MIVRNSQFDAVGILKVNHQLRSTLTSGIDPFLKSKRKDGPHTHSHIFGPRHGHKHTNKLKSSHNVRKTCLGDVTIKHLILIAARLRLNLVS